jgi:hypothetical protein
VRDRNPPCYWHIASTESTRLRHLLLAALTLGAGVAAQLDRVHRRSLGLRLLAQGWLRQDRLVARLDDRALRAGLSVARWDRELVALAVIPLDSSCSEEQHRLSTNTVAALATRRHSLCGRLVAARLLAAVLLVVGSSWAQASPGDFDDDGIPNAVETGVGLDPQNAADALLDLDGDGWRNLDEYRLGTAMSDECDTPLGQTSRHQKVFASDGVAGDIFGYSVAASGSTAVIGAYQDDDSGSNSGAAYVYTRSRGIWSQQQELTAAGGVAGDAFGRSVAVSGDKLVVGAPWDDGIGIGTDSGSAYVFSRSGATWSQQRKLTAADAAAYDDFGFGVAVSGDTVVVGALRGLTMGSPTGSAYVYARSGGTWSQQQKLTAADGAAGDDFGISVAVDGATALIGAWGDDDSGSDSGSAGANTQRSPPPMARRGTSLAFHAAHAGRTARSSAGLAWHDGNQWLPAETSVRAGRTGRITASSASSRGHNWIGRVPPSRAQMQQAPAGQPWEGVRTHASPRAGRRVEPRCAVPRRVPTPTSG